MSATSSGVRFIAAILLRSVEWGSSLAELLCSRPLSMSIPLTALLLVVGSSLGWSGFDLLRKLLVREVAPVALLFLLTAGTVPLFGAWLAIDGAAAPRPGYLAPALGSVLLNVVANLLFLTGM